MESYSSSYEHSNTSNSSIRDDVSLSGQFLVDQTQGGDLVGIMS
jgi:hypothetical protein